MELRANYSWIVLLIFLQLGVQVTFAQDEAFLETCTFRFVGKSIGLNKLAKDSLTAVAYRIKDNPECKVIVRGYCSFSKSSQQLSWDRVNTVIVRLIESEGINSDRLIFSYGEAGGDCNTVDVIVAPSSAEGPGTVPAPHPQLRKKG